MPATVSSRSASSMSAATLPPGFGKPAPHTRQFQRLVLAVFTPLPRLAVVLTVGLLMAACDGPDASHGSRSGVAESTVPDVQETRAPAVESSGPERPAPPAKGQPSVNLPSLPVGSNDNTADEKSVPHCVRVRWLGDQDVPHGFTVVVTGIQIKPDGIFTLGKTGCSTPACHQSGTSFSFSSEDNSCYVTTIPQVYQSDDESNTAELFLSGRVVCPTGKQSACNDFAAKAKADVEPIRLFPPTP